MKSAPYAYVQKDRAHSARYTEFRVAPTRITALLDVLRRGATIAQIQGAVGAGGASRATAQRYLAALRHGFGYAIEYDRRKKLYRLTGRGALHRPSPQV